MNSINKDYRAEMDWFTDGLDGEEEDMIHVEEFFILDAELDNLVNNLMIVDSDHFDTIEDNLRYHITAHGVFLKDDDGWLVLNDRPRRENYVVSRHHLNNWVDLEVHFHVPYENEDMEFIFD